MPEPALALMGTVARYVPSARHVTVESARIGVRSLPADELPVVGRVPGQDNLYTCVTHSGVTLGPLLAELAAGEILREDDDPLLTTFRPERFAARAA
ncbi:MAG: FAD-dependent oxidoreductase [Streptosporangiaceae bacterium]